MDQFPRNAVVFNLFVQTEERYGLSHRVRSYWQRAWERYARNYAHFCVLFYFGFWFLDFFPGVAFALTRNVHERRMGL